MFDRRALLAGAAATGLAACVPVDRSIPGRLAAKLRIIEAAAGGTLGVSLRDVASKRTLQYRGAELFPHCSSFKMSLAAMVLHQAERGVSGAVDRTLRWQESDLVFHSPFTGPRVAQGATARQLAEAIQKVSDNTAANILLREYGGPQALTAFWRSLGDQFSRLDRTETSLNNVPPGEVRDTTTPDAMAATVAALLFGDTMSDANKAVLRQWMVDTETGLDRVRAGLPGGWVAGDKTGTSFMPGAGSVYADIGFAIPPEGTPLTFAAYYRARETHQQMDAASLNVLKQVGTVLRDFAAE